jgi:hypothetical protein
MKRSKFSEEQVAYALRQAEAGTAVGDGCLRGERCFSLTNTGAWGRRLRVGNRVTRYFTE